MQFQSLMQNQAMDETIRKRLQERFVKNNENQVQVGLVKFLNESRILSDFSLKPTGFNPAKCWGFLVK